MKFFCYTMVFSSLLSLASHSAFSSPEPIRDITNPILENEVVLAYVTASLKALEKLEGLDGVQRQDEVVSDDVAELRENLKNLSILNRQAASFRNQGVLLKYYHTQLAFYSELAGPFKSAWIAERVKVLEQGILPEEQIGFYQFLDDSVSKLKRDLKEGADEIIKSSRKITNKSTLLILGSLVSAFGGATIGVFGHSELAVFSFITSAGLAFGGVSVANSKTAHDLIYLANTHAPNSEKLLADIQSLESSGVIALGKAAAKAGFTLPERCRAIVEE